MSLGFSLLLLHYLIEILLMVRVLLRPNRQPASRVAWLAIIAAIPGVGIIAYLLFGEVRVGQKITRRLKELEQKRQKGRDLEANLIHVEDRYLSVFKLGKSVSQFLPVSGNQAELMPDSNTTIDRIITDIEAAQEQVCLLFYIWLPDGNGLKLVKAVQEAASRGLKCRVMVDELGSRLLLKSIHWRQLQDAGVKVAIALPIGNPFYRMLTGRIDLRNHRKIVVIDEKITYCGSQNCADPEFRVKARYAPWVDLMVRFEGPVAQQNQILFMEDWLTYHETSEQHVLPPLSEKNSPVETLPAGVLAQVIGTGPTVRNSAMSEMFETMVFTARQELTMTTPYYVPDQSLQNAICTAAYRGVKTRLILPQRNDSFIVAAASRSCYAGLLQAGVEIYEYPDGLLHAKSITVDGVFSLIGSANMDRRSFDLNYENNILCHDRALTEKIYQRQQEYLKAAQQVTLEMVQSWSLSRRLWNNFLAIFGPLL